MRILIAEDDTISRRFLETQLAKWGYEVVSARDGNEAWQLLQSDAAPQIAILDWMMPGVDGVELCRRVREAGREPYTYLILLTALGGEGDLVTGMDAGADDYLTKPCRADELRVRLRAGSRIVELQNQLIQDLAERKRIEKEREQFLIFFQTSTDLMCIADPNGAFLRVNPALVGIWDIQKRSWSPGRSSILSTPTTGRKRWTKWHGNWRKDAPWISRTVISPRMLPCIGCRGERSTINRKIAPTRRHATSPNESGWKAMRK